MIASEQSSLRRGQHSQGNGKLRDRGAKGFRSAARGLGWRLAARPFPNLETQNKLFTGLEPHLQKRLTAASWVGEEQMKYYMQKGFVI